MVIGIKRVHLARDTERGRDTKSHVAVLGSEINTGDNGQQNTHTHTHTHKS